MLPPCNKPAALALYVQDAGDLYNADYAQTEELFRKLLSSTAGGSCPAPQVQQFIGSPR